MCLTRRLPVVTGDARGNGVCALDPARAAHLRRRRKGHRGREVLVAVADDVELAAARAQGSSDVEDGHGESPRAPRGVVTLGSFLAAALGARPEVVAQCEGALGAPGVVAAPPASVSEVRDRKSVV